MRRVAFVGSLVLVACGRLHFAPLTEGDDGGPTSDTTSSDTTSSDASLGTGPWSGLTMLDLGMAFDDPTMTGDGLELYVNTGGSVYVSTRASPTDAWSLATMVTSLPPPIYSPHLSYDGLTLYAAVPTPSRIITTSRTARTDSWGPYQAIPEISDPAGDDAPAVTSDGLTMVFDSMRTGQSVFLTTRPATSSTWSTPVELPELTAPGFAGRPHLTDDLLSIYFQGPGLTAANDIWVAHRASPTAPFDPPQRVAETDSNGGEEDAWLSADQHVMLFCSGRNGVAIWQLTR
jgi:hypothetical protein